MESIRKSQMMHSNVQTMPDFSHKHMKSINVVNVK
jgi:hypothetical protein